jgi:hypothetical protein
MTQNWGFLLAIQWIVRGSRAGAANHSKRGFLLVISWITLPYFSPETPKLARAPARGVGWMPGWRRGRSAIQLSSGRLSSGRAGSQGAVKPAGGVHYVKRGRWRGARRVSVLAGGFTP